jgi:hypothetical protein
MKMYNSDMADVGRVHEAVKKRLYCIIILEEHSMLFHSINKLIKAIARFDTLQSGGSGYLFRS